MSMKKLFAIHRDANGNVNRTKIAEGSTADFAGPIGFQVEGNNMSGSSIEPIELAGTYPALIEEHFRHLEGKLLTLCDATFTNKEQREAFKKLVSNSLWDYFQGEVQDTIRLNNITE